MDTHARSRCHISGLVHEFKENGGAGFDIEKIYYNMPNYDELMQKTEGEVPDIEYFRRELSNLVGFNSILPMIGDRAYVVEQGETLEVDECKIEVLYTYHDGLYSNLMNDSSVVFMLTTPSKKVLFLGDLGPEGGVTCFMRSRETSSRRTSYRWLTTVT